MLILANTTEPERDKTITTSSKLADWCTISRLAALLESISFRRLSSFLEHLLSLNCKCSFSVAHWLKVFQNLICSVSKLFSISDTFSIEPNSSFRSALTISLSWWNPFPPFSTPGIYGKSMKLIIFALIPCLCFKSNSWIIKAHLNSWVWNKFWKRSYFSWRKPLNSSTVTTNMIKLQTTIMNKLTNH